LTKRGERYLLAKARQELCGAKVEALGANRTARFRGEKAFIASATTRTDEKRVERWSAAGDLKHHSHSSDDSPRDSRGSARETTNALRFFRGSAGALIRIFVRRNLRGSSGKKKRPAQKSWA
jgi:hypothetical protein